MTRRRRWPGQADAHRSAAIEQIRHARACLITVQTNRSLSAFEVELHLADAERQLSDAENHLLRARLGEPDTDRDQEPTRSLL